MVIFMGLGLTKSAEWPELKRGGLGLTRLGVKGIRLRCGKWVRL